MQLTLKRLKDTGEETLGRLMVPGVGDFYVLEDQYRPVKVKGDTRIPAGTYAVKFRTWGGHHIKYGQKFPAFHKGMLQLQNVPGFEGILFHIGNTEKDTDGCLLVGTTFTESKAGRITIQGSTLAYQKMYPPIAAALSRGEKVFITITDNART